MKNKKHNQPVLHQVTRKTSSFPSVPAISYRLKGIIITFSVWGWLPLGLANWILRKEKAIDSAKHFKEIV